MSDAPAGTDRGMWRVVAARDFSVRLRDKGFVISTAITVTVLTVFILVRAYASGTDAFALGVVGDRATADTAAAVGERAGLDVAVTSLPDDEAADRALRDGRTPRPQLRRELPGCAGRVRRRPADARGRRQHAADQEGQEHGILDGRHAAATAARSRKC